MERITWIYSNAKNSLSTKALTVDPNFGANLFGSTPTVVADHLLHIMTLLLFKKDPEDVSITLLTSFHQHTRGGSPNQRKCYLLQTTNSFLGIVKIVHFKRLVSSVLGTHTPSSLFFTSTSSDRRSCAHVN